MIPVSSLTRRAALAAAALLAAAPAAHADARKKATPPLVSAQAVTTDLSFSDQGGPGFLATVRLIAFRFGDSPGVFDSRVVTVFLPGALRAEARRTRLAGQLRILVGGDFDVAPDRVDLGVL